MTLKYFAEKPIIMELPPTPVTALTLLTLECTEFVEPYIPEDQERDEATGQPKKKARLNGGDDSMNGGSPASQHATISTSNPAMPSNGTPTSRPDHDQLRLPASAYSSSIESSRPQYMPRSAQSYMPSPRPFPNPFSPSSWSPLGSTFSKPTIPTPHPYTTIAALPQAQGPNMYPRSNGTTPTLAKVTPTTASPLPASSSVPLPGSGRPELPNFGPQPVHVSTLDVQLAMQAEMDRQHEERMQASAKEKERKLEVEREKERKWEEMRAKAASIVETVRKEGINGGFI